jgi:hypothetical protein
MQGVPDFHRSKGYPDVNRLLVQSQLSRFRSVRLSRWLQLFLDRTLGLFLPLNDSDAAG